MIDIFIDEVDRERVEAVFSKEELELGFIASAILFFFAGFDTTSTTMSVIVHAFTHHPDIQEQIFEQGCYKFKFKHKSLTDLRIQLRMYICWQLGYLHDNNLIYRS